MPSPFPGMDPYLEDPAFWSDFHPTFLGCWREAVADQLPETYEARLNESVNLVQRDEIKAGRVEILHRPDRSLIAVLELLSPWNKTGDGFHEYCAKRNTIMRQKVHLVELDFLLAGNRLALPPLGAKPW